MDPRNFLNEVRIFQFEKLIYDENINTELGVDKILYGTDFYNKLVSYKDNNGNVINTSKKYSELIMEAGVYSGVNPYHLAARIKQELGGSLLHDSISGNVQGYKGLYNFYNIGATSSTDVLGAIKNGLQYALNGKGQLTSTEMENQLIPWNSPERAIKGGAIFIGKSYILVGQNCLYLQKFDVNEERSANLFWHQYMTNCLAPYREAKFIYTGYNNLGILNSPLGFIIPVYENMPEIPVDSPDININEYVIDNTKVYANVTTRLNVRSGPGTEYEAITMVLANEEFTRIGRGIQNGDRWDKVLLNNGIIGYVSQNYVGIYEPSNEENYYFELDNSVKTDGNELYLRNNLTINTVKNLINTNYKIEIYDNDNNLILDENRYLGTGNTIIIKNKQNEEIIRYMIIVSGDVNGDGYINSLDVLILQKYILELRTLEGVYLKAGNIAQNGELPTALDVLKIQKHILEIKLLYE